VSALRTVIGVIVGYVIFAVSAALLFQLTGQKPHAVVATSFMLVSIVYGMLFAAVGGWVAEMIGKNPWKPAVGVAIVIAGGAIASILATPSSESRWSQWSAIFLMAPSVLIGGWLATRRIRH